MTMSEGERLGMLLAMTKDNYHLMQALKKEPGQILKGSTARMARRMARDFDVCISTTFGEWSLTSRGYEVMEGR